MHTTRLTDSLLLVVSAFVLLGSVKGFVSKLKLKDTKYKLSSNTHGKSNAWHGILSLSATPKPSTLKDKSISSAANGVEIPKIGSISFLLPSQGADTIPSKFGQYSPIENPSLLQAAQHLAKKAGWFSDDQVETMIKMVPSSADNGVDDTLHEVNVLIALGLSSASDLEFAEKLFQDRAKRDKQLRFRQCQFALDCAKQLPSTVGPFDEINPSLESSLLPWTDDASGARFLDQMKGLFDRWTSDDFTVALMLFLNRFSGSEVDWVKSSADATWEKGPVRNTQEFVAMATKCGDCIAKCLGDESCKKCLETLTEMDTRDQAASYRTIVSYESDLLREFSFCILQKNNIFNSKAEIPLIPKVTPIASWRGNPLTVEAARSLLIGHLDDEAAPEVSKGFF
jgi:hypothetical protein